MLQITTTAPYCIMSLILQYNISTFIGEPTFFLKGNYYYWYQLFIIWGIHCLHPSRRAFIDSFRLKLRRQYIFYGICSCELLYSSHLMNSLQEIPAHHFSFVLPARFWFRSDECTQVNLLTDLLHVQQIIILNVARIVFSNIYSTAHENHI